MSDKQTSDDKPEMSQEQKIEFLNARLNLLDGVVLSIKEVIQSEGTPDMQYNMSLIGNQWQQAENDMLMNFNLPVTHFIP